jgi:hypothetical protein
MEESQTVGQLDALVRLLHDFFIARPLGRLQCLVASTQGMIFETLEDKNASRQ